MQLFSRDRDQQYCVKAFHKIRGPRQCNCYRVQVNNDFAQNTVGYTDCRYMNVSARTKQRTGGWGWGWGGGWRVGGERRTEGGTEAQNVEAIY